MELNFSSVPFWCYTFEDLLDYFYFYRDIDGLSSILFGYGFFAVIWVLLITIIYWLDRLDFVD